MPTSLRSSGAAPLRPRIVEAGAGDDGRGSARATAVRQHLRDRGAVDPEPIGERVGLDCAIPTCAVNTKLFMSFAI